MRTPPTHPQMTQGPDPGPNLALSPEELEADRRLEVLLDEMVRSDGRDRPLPSDFTLRVVAARPYAPWEVRRPSTLRVPVAVAGGLVGGAAVLSLTPLWTLGPGTALVTWGDLLAAALANPVSAAAQAGPRLAEAFSLVSAAVPGGAAAFGLAALLAGGTATLALRRSRT